MAKSAPDNSKLFCSKTTGQVVLEWFGSPMFSQRRTQRSELTRV